MKKIVFITVILATLLVQSILIIPCLVIKILSDRDISGILIKPYLNILDKIPQDYFSDKDYRFIYGFPKEIKNRLKTPITINN